MSFRPRRTNYPTSTWSPLPVVSASRPADLLPVRARSRRAPTGVPAGPEDTTEQLQESPSGTDWLPAGAEDTAEQLQESPSFQSVTDALRVVQRDVEGMQDHDGLIVYTGTDSLAHDIPTTRLGPARPFLGLQQRGICPCRLQPGGLFSRFPLRVVQAPPLPPVRVEVVAQAFLGHFVALRPGAVFVSAVVASLSLFLVGRLSWFFSVVGRFFLRSFSPSGGRNVPGGCPRWLHHRKFYHLAGQDNRPRRQALINDQRVRIIVPGGRLCSEPVVIRATDHPFQSYLHGTERAE